VLINKSIISDAAITISVSVLGLIPRSCTHTH